MGCPGDPAKPTVLVVDDDALIRLDLAVALSDAGYRVIEVANADDAIEVLTTCRDVSIMVTDVQMPGLMDGAKLARVVRDRWPPVRIIVVSGYHRSNELDLPTESQFFAKPLNTQRLIGTIREMAS